LKVFYIYVRYYLLFPRYPETNRKEITYDV